MPRDQEQQPSREIVGVVGTIDEPRSSSSHVNGDLYVPWSQMPFSEVALLVSGAGPQALTAAARRAIHRIDGAQVVERTGTLEQVVEHTRSGQRMLVSLLVVMAAIALALASIGIYGVVSHGVSQRTRELGIRMALGAQQSAVVGLVLRQALGLTAAGVLAGVALSVPLVRVLESMFYLRGESLGAPLALMGAILMAVAFLASLIPAHRATKVDPMIALRSE